MAHVNSDRGIWPPTVLMAPLTSSGSESLQATSHVTWRVVCIFLNCISYESSDGLKNYLVVKENFAINPNICRFKIYVRSERAIVSQVGYGWANERTPRMSIIIGKKGNYKNCQLIIFALLLVIIVN
ncbi:hypothetical protein J6590_063181 [Homalodisca vitripennis]|nr:hypothetical protein J6590_063181 [Homalodisca vitripennis]